MASETEFACCFCGKRILKTKYDPGSLLFTPAFETSGQKAEQGLYCHAACLEQHVHPDVKLYALTIVDNPEDD